MSARTGLRLLSGYMNWLAEHASPSAMYRGHANTLWELKPGAYREGQSGIKDNQRLRQWIVAAGRLADPLPRKNMEWLVLAQHEGLPTTLLDWTTNPLIALFFACEDEPSGKSNGRVTHIDRIQLDVWDVDGTDDPFVSLGQAPTVLDASAMNMRSRAQDSFMTVHNNQYQDMDFENIITNSYTISFDDKLDIRHALAAMGITEARLYVDLARVVKAMRAQYLFQDSLSKNYPKLSVGNGLKQPVSRNL